MRRYCPPAAPSHPWFWFEPATAPLRRRTPLSGTLPSFSSLQESFLVRFDRNVIFLTSRHCGVYTCSLWRVAFVISNPARARCHNRKSNLMPIRSMTGFARVSRSTPFGELSLSIKTVNHRGLDMHFHMPLEFDAIEPAL